METTKGNYLKLLFICIGFSAMITQIIILRELLLFFTGNELTLGIILGLWLFWTAIGSGLMGRLIRFFSNCTTLFIYCQLSIVILLPLSIIFIRLSRLIFNIQVGEIISPGYIFVIPMIALAPICSIFGFLYTLGCKLLSEYSKNQSTIPGKVYLFEAIGSGVAGFLTSIILFRYLNNFQIAAIVCIVNIIAATLFWIFISKKKYFFLITAVLTLSIIFYFPKLHQFSIKNQWQPFEILKSTSTIYGDITVAKIGDSHSFYENGSLIYTHPDLMYTEESVHFALLEHPCPKNILLIGGNAGNLEQILFHPQIEHVDFVFIDPQLIEINKEFIPEFNSILKDSRIHSHQIDGRLFIKKAQIKYDVIIVNLPDPQTTQLNRFFTKEFYFSAQKKLKENGILSFSATSSPNVISSEQKSFLKCLYNTMAQVFDEILLIPGDSVHFIGCLSKNILTENPAILVNRLKERNLPTKFISEYYIPYRMDKQRMQYVIEQITSDKSNLINTDFQPVAYLNNTILWLTYFNTSNTDFVDKVLKLFSSVVIFIVVIIALFYFYFKRHSKKIQSKIHYSIYFLIMLIGFSTISLEVLIILGFQAIYGYAYYQLSLIISGFMIGLTAGSWLSLKTINKLAAPYKKFLRFQFSMTLYPIFTLSILMLLAKLTLHSSIIQIVFFVLIAGAGFIGGYQFPLANHLAIGRKSDIVQTGGAIYAFDLLGSVIGAILTSALLIPVLGILKTCFVFSFLNLLGLVILYFNPANMKK